MSVRVSIFLVALLIILGGGILISQVLRTGTPSERKDRLYRVNTEEITGIKLTHQGKEVVFALNGDNWFIREEKDTPVDIKRWGGIPVLVSGPQVARTLKDEELADLASYGLTPPVTVLELATRGGQTIKVDIGSQTPTKDNYYIKVEGSSTVFLMFAQWVDVITRLVTDPPRGSSS